jgi:hypothetical protein
VSDGQPCLILQLSMTPLDRSPEGGVLATMSSAEPAASIDKLFIAAQQFMGHSVRQHDTHIHINLH